MDLHELAKNQHCVLVALVNVILNLGSSMKYVGFKFDNISCILNVYVQVKEELQIFKDLHYVQQVVQIAQLKLLQRGGIMIISINLYGEL